MKWHAIEKGFIELDEKGAPTGRRHPFSYHEAHGHVMRVRHNEDGSTTPEVHLPRNIIAYNPQTGDIQGIHRGFALMVEIHGIDAVKITDASGTEYKNIEIASLPADLEQDVEVDVVDPATKKVTGRESVRRFAYRIDVKKGKLVPVSDGDLHAPIVR